jgi:hypothetical protein
MEYARQMQEDAQALRDIDTQVSGLIINVSWLGSRAEKFRSDWQGTARPHLLKVAGVLEDTAQFLNKAAQEQQLLSG